MEESLNDILIDIEAELKRNENNEDALIQEAFLLWYAMLEGIDCESFSEKEMRGMLQKNHETFIREFSDSPDYSFIMGWMISISPWYFNSEQEIGEDLLGKAYKSQPKNSLFKWANRESLNLKKGDIDNLKIDINVRFRQLYNHSAFIENYFLGIM